MDTLESVCIDRMRKGVLVYKMKDSKPTRRLVYLSSDGASLCWRSPNSKEVKAMERAEAMGGRLPTADPSAQTQSSSWFSRASSKQLQLADILAVHYGPYYSDAFAGFLQSCDAGVGKAWLALTLEAVDTVMDLIFPSVGDLATWLTGLQVLAPVNCRAMSPGKARWVRVIMKINHVGFRPFVTQPDRNWTPELTCPGVL